MISMMLKVDRRRRIYIPKSVKLETDEVILIPMGSFYLLVPVPRNIIEIDADIERELLKKIAEYKARMDALQRLSRRKRRFNDADRE